MRSKAKARTLSWYWRSISQDNHTRIELCCVLLWLGMGQPLSFNVTLPPENNVWSTVTQLVRFMGPILGPLGSCRPQVGPMLTPRTLLSGKLFPCLWDALYIYLLFSTVLLTQLLWRSSAENGNITSRLDRDTAPFMDYTRTIDQILLQSDIQEVIYLNNGKIQPQKSNLWLCFLSIIWSAWYRVRC